jgi:iron complex outermembrane receptor protein
MKVIRYSFLLILIISATFAYAQQTGTITGKVLDDNKDPISGALVELEGTQIKANANNAGEFTMKDVPAGTYTIRASTYSYRTQTAQVTVSAGQTLTQEFTLPLDLLSMEQLVVTGSTAPESKIESSTTISTLSNEEIQEAAPRSATEYLRRVPGFTRVESSGGEVNQNISVRGVLGVETVNIQEDGMPVYPTMHVFFMNADNLIRLDENIDTVEIVRGSDSPIYGSSASAAILNFINKTGGDTLHGAIKGSAGEGGLGRFDFNTNGPLSDEWRFNVGGFYRYDHGIRDPGFPGTKGGQIKANVTRLLSNGYFRISAKFLDDRNQFILPLPFQNPNNPDFVTGFTKNGSFNTREGVDVSVPLVTGDHLKFPLDDGIRTKGAWLTGEYNFTFGDNWNFVDTVQGMSVDHQWNALPPGTSLNANEYARGILNGLIANGTVPAGSTFQLLFTNNLDPNGHKRPFDTANGLINPAQIFHVEKPISSFANNLVVRKSYKNNDLAFGSYFAYYTQDNVWNFANILTDVSDNPHFLDLVVHTPNGSTVDVTKNGFRQFLNFYVNAHGNNTLFSTFAADKIKVTDRLRIDAGLRYERQNYFQVAENTSSFDLDNNPVTTFDVETFGNNTFRQFEFTIDDFAGSVGANYQLKPDHLALYGSFTRGFWMPALDEFMFEPSQASVDLFQPRHTNMFEGGVKYSGPMVGFTATVYYAKLYNITSRGVENDPNGNPVFVTRSQPGTNGWGMEFEVLTRPASGLELRSALTFTDTQASATAQAGSRYRGLTPAVIDFEAGYEVAKNARVSFDAHFVGSRITTPIGVVPEVTLDNYAYVNLGGTYKFEDSGFTVGIGLLNITNSEGFEEGDPRNDPNRGTAANIFNARPLLPRRVQADVRYDW